MCHGVVASKTLQHKLRVSFVVLILFAKCVELKFSLCTTVENRLHEFVILAGGNIIAYTAKKIINCGTWTGDQTVCSFTNRENQTKSSSVPFNIIKSMFLFVNFIIIIIIIAHT